MQHLEIGDDVALALNAANDFTDKLAAYAIGLDQDQSSLGAHMPILWAKASLKKLDSFLRICPSDERGSRGFTLLSQEVGGRPEAGEEGAHEIHQWNYDAVGNESYLEQ